MLKEKDFDNPDKEESVEMTTGLKQLVVDYVGERFDPEDGNVTVQMVLEVFAAEFPEFIGVLAEENFMRGYSQALADDKAMKEVIKEDSIEEQHKEKEVKEKEEPGE